MPIPGVWACDGDSQTTGQLVAAGADWPSQAVPFLAGRGLRFSKFNLAVGGETITDLINRGAATDAYRKASSSWGTGLAADCYTVMAGLNTGGATAAQLLASMTTLVQARRAAGWARIVVSTVVGSNAAVILDFNNLLRAVPLGTLWDRLADPASDSRLASLAAPYFSDGVHMAAPGMVVCAPYLANSVEEAVGADGVLLL